MATYTSQYPTQDGDHVKATTTYDSRFEPYMATDPALSVTGSYIDNSWHTTASNPSNQRFHIDLGSAKIIRRIYYENGHHVGGSTTQGINNFTFQGSNTGSGTFDDLVFANDEGWTNITTAAGTWVEHTGADQADPQYMTVTNTTAYRYYAFKFADNHGDANYQTIRRVELQTEDGYGEAEDNAILFGFNF